MIGLALLCVSVSVQASEPIDFTKIEYWTGEGDNCAALMLRWNDNVATDNLVMGVRFNGRATVQSLIDQAVAGNDRFTSNNDAGSLNYSYDMVLADADELAGYTKKFNHDSSETGDAKWKIFVSSANDGGFTLVGRDHEVSGNTVVALDYTSADTLAEFPYTFYIPYKDFVGVRTLDTFEEYICDAVDGLHYMPTYVGVPSSSMIYARGAQILDPATGKACKEIVSRATFGALSTLMSFELTGKKAGAVDAVILVTVQDKETKKREYYYDTCHVVIKAPLVPMTSFRFKDNPIEVKFKGLADAGILYEPVNATYTKINVSAEDKDVATYLTTGMVSGGTRSGQTVLHASYIWNPEITAETTVNMTLNQMVEDIAFGDNNGELHVTYPDIVSLISAKALPENADIKTLEYELSDNSHGVVYASTQDFIPNKTGKVNITFKAVDGSDVSKTFTIVIDEPQSIRPKDNYQDGVLWLNEDWFGHRNSSMNYLDANDEVYYHAFEFTNPGHTFGATAQYGMIYGNRLYVMSKQAKDTGDGRDVSGGRLVISDATTLEKITSFDTLIGDGRSCLGVNPSKVYLATSKGIQILNVDNANNVFTLGGAVEKEDGINVALGSETGDMVRAGDYVFAVEKGHGFVIIDTRIDKYVGYIADSTPCGVLVTPDGHVWCASETAFYEVDSMTFETLNTYKVGSSGSSWMKTYHGVQNPWSAWRSANFFYDEQSGTFYWGRGNNNFNIGLTKLYKWKPGESMPTDAFCTINYGTVPASPDPAGTKTFSAAAYGTAGFDTRTGEFLVMSCTGANTSARFTSFHRVNPKDGAVIKTVRLKDYFWFPAMPIFPDKYDPEISIDALSIDFEQGKQSIDLSEYVTDRDNQDRDIRLSVVDECMTDVEPVFSMDGKRLIVNPSGEPYPASFTLAAESNGKIVTKKIHVGIHTGISSVISNPGMLRIDGSGNVEVCGLTGQKLDIFTSTGSLVLRVDISQDIQTVDVSGFPSGVYIVKAGVKTLKFMK